MAAAQDAGAAAAATTPMPDLRAPPRGAFFYHILQLQYRAVYLSVAVSHLWRARKLLRRLGICAFILVFFSPNRIVRGFCPFFLARTINFLEPPRNRRGVLYFIIPYYILYLFIQV